MKFTILRTHVGVCLAMLCLCCGFSTQGFGQDKVYPKQGAVATGKIQSITRAEVTIEVRGNAQKLPLADVRKITFDDEPNTLDRARELYAQEQYDQVLEELKKIDNSTVKNPLVAQDIEFYRYYSEGKLGLNGVGGDKEKAAAGLVALARKNSNSHHMFALSELLGDLAVALGKPEGAVNYYNVLLGAPTPDVKARGVYRLALLELAQGKTAEAKTRFTQLTGANATTPEMARIKSLGEVGLAVCEVRDNKPQQALDQLKQMVEKYDSTDQELFARIYNAQGACYTALNQDNLAVLAYLRTDYLFFSNADAHAESLYYLSQLFPKIGEPAKAAEARARLIAQYAGSAWANKN
jgi:tetratricopeptide (TPR) repeat protein